MLLTFRSAHTAALMSRRDVRSAILRVNVPSFLRLVRRSLRSVRNILGSCFDPVRTVGTCRSTAEFGLIQIGRDVARNGVMTRTVIFNWHWEQVRNQLLTLLPHPWCAARKQAVHAAD